MLKPVDICYDALTGVEQDDWSIEFDAEHMHFGQDGLDDFDWSNKADDAPVSLALMATNSEAIQKEDLKDYAIMKVYALESMTGDKDKLLILRFKGMVMGPLEMTLKMNDVYSLESKIIIPSGGITCLVAKATEDEAVLWHRRLGHVNFKNINKLLKAILLEVYLQRHSAWIISCGSRKVKRQGFLQEDMRKELKFSWVFFLAYKDETYDMLHDLIVGLENRLRHKVKTIRLILPIQFWAEAVNTACYVLNRVLVTKPQMKTPYEILMGRSPNISFMRPFGCSLTILNTLDHLEQGIACDDAEDLDDQQFIVHTTQPMPPEERTAAKEVKLSSEDQALHDELVSLMHQESLAKAHNDDQRIAFEEEKRRISIAKGKEHIDSTFTLSGVADYNNLDPTIDVPSTPTLRIHKIHSQVKLLAKVLLGFKQEESFKTVLQINIKHCCLSYTSKIELTTKISKHACLLVSYLKRNPRKSLSLS
ncbi:putative ribonuclease H-like domain-containing protein [Tanacetum coccineum]